MRAQIEELQIERDALADFIDSQIWTDVTYGTNEGAILVDVSHSVTSLTPVVRTALRPHAICFNKLRYLT